MTSIPPPSGPPTTPDGWSIPTGPPPAPEGWLPGQAVAYPDAPQRAPRWGIGDVALGLLFVFAVVVISSVAGLILVGFDALESLADGDLSGTDAAIFLGLATFGQSLAMGAWPFIVSRWKGNGVVKDFGLRFKPIDLAWGASSAFIVLLLAGGLGYALTEALDVGNDESTNTQIISDADGTASLWIIVIAAVVLAPIVEELFFRGLCLRAIERRFGTTAGVIGSTVLFTIPHFTNPSVAGTIVLFSIIGMVGLVMAILVVKLDRLGPAIVAHAIFNAVGVIGVLAG